MNEQAPVQVGETLDFSISTINSRQFIVKTRSIFTNIYLITANTDKDAIEFALNTNETPLFIQHHEGESLVLVGPVSSNLTFDDLKMQYPDYA